MIDEDQRRARARGNKAVGRDEYSSFTPRDSAQVSEIKDTVKALQVALNLGMEARLALETPLMWIDKAETWRMAHDLGGAPLVDLVVRDTHTCYQGDRGHRHDWGAGCGACDACRLRAAGWQKWKASLAP